MKVLTISRAFLVVALALGLLAAMTAGTPQKLSENSIAVGGACNDCSGVDISTCQEEASESGCTDTTAVFTCYSDAPDSGTCSNNGTIKCDLICRRDPNNESCP